MALYITLNDNVQSDSRRGWHVGEPRPGAANNPEWVESVQADGGELDWILAMFVNLQYPLIRVVSWYGDQAKQIVSALPRESK